MKNYFLFVIAIILALPVASQAQKIKVKKGKLDFLKNESKLLLEFDYSEMGVGKYKKEEDYLDERQAKLNKKDEGTGDEWRIKWVEDRNERFEPKFIELFNENIDGLMASEDAEDALYKAVVKTTFTEPGYNVGISRRNAHINLEIQFVEIESGETVSMMTLDKSPGRIYGGYDFDTGTRIQEAYAKAGKELAKYLRKKAR